MVRDQEPKGRGGEDVGLFAAHNAKRRAGAQGRKKRAVFQFARWHAAQKSPEKMRLGRSGFGHFRQLGFKGFAQGRDRRFQVPVLSISPTEEPST